MPPLHAELSGPSDPAGMDADRATPALVLLHGFTQTGRLWGPFGDELERHHPTVRMDLPGHGDSGDVEARDLWHTADLVAASVDPALGKGNGPNQFDLCGYSLGARVALHVVLAHPTVVRRLVVISGTAGIDDDAARTARRQRDEETADELSRSGDAAGFVDRWLASPMFATLPPATAGATERLRNTAAGLAASLRSAGTGTQELLWDRLADVTAPVLVIAGADDPRFARTAARLRDALPRATMALIPGAGHAVHLQQPWLTARTVGTWLDSVDD